jgi:hypothetical protein
MTADGNQQQPSAAAVEAFKVMRKLEQGSAEWWVQHRVLHRALGCRPWEWPCIVHPDTPRANRHAVARWRTLERAAAEAPAQPAN